MDRNIKNIISSKICSHCGGETDGWRCAVCGQEAAQYDPLHKCGGGKFQPKCKACGQAEDNCTCAKTNL
ncbi:MAG: hypothetical protein A2174_00315 [Candidatus Portnoybacteria bacterium RBG_13_41_18]|uniref:Uncharacterized protein n=1 Tax=Candidatus Portnoybacteria bacterium RBG_13_41_18 TaxID=1801991 RepID=A0A1G2FB87_9BACT|nr:MAG: hypothetical protein A2174_00315 [Candidatus Portnoybacteria bacterium RBG_13_41_18]